jgi:hypothetical protein
VAHPDPQGPRILVLVLSIDREPWRTIEATGQRATWAAPARRPPGVDVVYYYGRHGLRRYPARLAARLMRADGSDSVVRRPLPDASALDRLLAAVGRAGVSRVSERTAAAPCSLAGDRLFCRVPEVYALTLPKLLAVLRFAASGRLGEFDYVYRTNTSAYVNLHRLQAVAAGLPSAGCYAGWIVERKSDGLPFVTGGGILMSRDVVQLFAERTDWNWGTIDDGALGEAAVDLGLTPARLERVLVRGAEDVERLPEDVLRETVVFRCKTHSAQRADQQGMLALDARLWPT